MRANIQEQRRILAEKRLQCISDRYQKAEQTLESIAKYNEETDNFLRTNSEKNSKFIGKLFLIAFGLGPVLAVMRLINFFTVSYGFCLYVTACSIILGSGFFLSLKFSKDQRVPMNIGILNLALFMALIGWNPDLDFYISFSVIPFVCCIYLSVPFTIYSCIFTYFLLDFSIFRRAMIMFSGIDIHSPEFIQWIGARLGGYSIEFCIIAVIAVFITRSLREKFLSEVEKKSRIEAIQQRMIQAFANIVEWNDPFTGQHIKRTSLYVEIIAHKLVSMGYYADVLDEATIQMFVKAAPLHDLGKISVPNTILTKEGKLTDEEFEIMKSHSKSGYDIIKSELSGIESPEYVQIAEDMALYHHEKWNGFGYPEKKSALEIPLCARIMAAADVLDALLSKRQYKDAFSIEKTMNIFRESSGTHFEPCIAEAVLGLEEEIKKISGAE